MTCTSTNLQSLISSAYGGGPNHYDTMSNRMGFYYSEGCSILSNNGCGWLISDMIIKMGLDRKCRNTHSIKFVPNKNGGGRVNYYTTDERTGNSVKIAHQDYIHTSIDFPLHFFIGECLGNDHTVKNLLMLAQEY